jgi:S1-C subfamily serine protease
MVDIQKKLYEYQDGDKSEFKILRNGEELKLVLTLRNRPDGI